VFQLLVTRFPKQPKVIIYDNGCNLSEYVLNRAPGPFRDTYILNDGFHWKNHTNCGESYNSKLYRALDSILNLVSILVRCSRTKEPHFRQTQVHFSVYELLKLCPLTYLRLGCLRSGRGFEI
jgi:hypothetical protein